MNKELDAYIRSIVLCEPKPCLQVAGLKPTVFFYKELDKHIATIVGRGGQTA